MAQQINLCTPILLTQRRYFSATTMVQALSAIVVLGGGLGAFWVWSLNTASEGYKKTLATQAREVESLQLAMTPAKAGTGAADAALTQELQARRSELAQREILLEDLQRGLFRAGWGHAARLQLLSQSIPPPVWLTEVKADDATLEVSGFTLEPAALNGWVAKLATSPLLQGQSLSTVKVESVSQAATTRDAGSATAASAPAPVRSVWSFNLLSKLAKP